MGEVLADASLAGEDRGERRADVGGARMIFEIRLDARSELACGLEDRPTGREGLGAIDLQRLDTVHQRRVMDELARFDGNGKAAIAQRGADLLPGRRRSGRRGFGKAYIDGGSR